MPEPLVDQILHHLDHVTELYFRLVLIVGPAGSGKTEALHALQASTGAPLLNLNLELSRRMLELTERQRTEIDLIALPLRARITTQLARRYQATMRATPPSPARSLREFLTAPGVP